jgi:hypothetical protein
MALRIGASLKELKFGGGGLSPVGSGRLIERESVMMARQIGFLDLYLDAWFERFSRLPFSLCPPSFCPWESQGTQPVGATSDPKWEETDGRRFSMAEPRMVGAATIGIPFRMGGMLMTGCSVVKAKAAIS